MNLFNTCMPTQTPTQNATAATPTQASGPFAQIFQSLKKTIGEAFPPKQLVTPDFNPVGLRKVSGVSQSLCSLADLSEGIRYAQQPLMTAKNRADSHDSYMTNRK